MLYTSCILTSSIFYTHSHLIHSPLKEPSHRDHQPLPPLPVKAAAKVPMPSLLKRNAITRFPEPTMAAQSPGEIATSERSHLYSSDKVYMFIYVLHCNCSYCSVTIYFHTVDHTWDVSISSYAKENQTKALSSTQKASR